WMFTAGLACGGREARREAYRSWAWAGRHGRATPGTACVASGRGARRGYGWRALRLSTLRRHDGKPLTPAPRGRLGPGGGLRTPCDHSLTSEFQHAARGHRRALIAERAVEMCQLPTARHAPSRDALCPRNRESAGKWPVGRTGGAIARRVPDDIDSSPGQPP